MEVEKYNINDHRVNEKFREINSLVKSLVTSLVSTNVDLTEKWLSTHSVEITEICSYS